MEKKESIELIKGKFTPDDAREILLSLLNSKISFHNLKDWTARERTGHPDPDSAPRLQRLRESRIKVDALFPKSAAENNKEKFISIHSVIEIHFED